MSCKDPFTPSESGDETFLMFDVFLMFFTFTQCEWMRLSILIFLFSLCELTMDVNLTHLLAVSQAQTLNLYTP